MVELITYDATASFDSIEIRALAGDALLIEREPSLGGDCLHFGCVPSKTLIQSANVYHT